MKATQLLHNLGQSIWLANITRELLDSGTLQHYVDELSVTGLTSNPTIFDHAIKNSTAYDAAIREKLSKGKSGEALFFELALEDSTRADSTAAWTARRSWPPHAGMGETPWAASSWAAERTTKKCANGSR
jgi:hypothetical protein